MIDTKVQIRFADIDMFRHVNNVAIQHYYDAGIYHYYGTVLKRNDLLDMENSLVKVSITTNFYAPIHLDDVISVKTKNSKIGNKSITLYQEIYDDKGVKKSDCTTILAGFNINTEQSCEIPLKWKKLISEHDGITF